MQEIRRAGDRGYADHGWLKSFHQGMVTSLLNPKAYLFMLAVFPQFMKPEYGDIGTQAVVLWLIMAATQVAVFGGMALAGDRVRVWFSERQAANI